MHCSLHVAALLMACELSLQSLTPTCGLTCPDWHHGPLPSPNPASEAYCALCCRFQDAALYMAWKQGLQLLLALLFSPTGLAVGGHMQPSGPQSQRDIAKGYRALAATMTAHKHRNSELPAPAAWRCCHDCLQVMQAHIVAGLPRNSWCWRRLVGPSCGIGQLGKTWQTCQELLR